MNRDDSHAGTSRGRSDPSFPWIGDELDRLAVRIYKTYGARREAARRLQNRGAVWTLLLVFSAVVAAVASIVLLIDAEALGPRGSAILAALGVVSLVASLMVASARFEVRSERQFRGYREFQSLASEAELGRRSLAGPDERGKAAHRFDSAYQKALDESENHAPADHYRASPPLLTGTKSAASADPSRKNDIVSFLQFVWRWAQLLGSLAVTLLPLVLAVGPILIGLQLVAWLTGG
jgi:hypothetical protein